jgi:antitoxin component YwqK of YwqJK toxin-antitoxin module
MRLWSKITQLFLPLMIGSIFSSIFSSISYGQTDPYNTYFNRNNEDCDSINAIGFRKVVYSFEDEKSIQTVQSFRMNGTLESEKIKIIKSYPKNSSTQLESTHEPYNFQNKNALRKLYDSLESLKEIQHLYQDHLEGAFEKFYPNGALKAKGFYHLNNYDDTLIGYYPNGALKRIDIFCNGKLIEGKCFGTDGKDTTHFPFFQQASFPGGNSEMRKYIQKNLVYPQPAKDNHITGKCYLKFKVNTLGEISEITVMRGVAGCPECDKEFIRVVKSMPNWTPEIEDESLKESYYFIPVMFNFE